MSMQLLEKTSVLITLEHMSAVNEDAPLLGPEMKRLYNLSSIMASFDKSQ